MSKGKEKMWLDNLRAADREETRQQERRDRHRGKLDTAGRGGVARRLDLDEAMGFAAGEIDLDGRSIEEDD
jgi:hypothetical protein